MDIRYYALLALSFSSLSAMEALFSNNNNDDATPGDMDRFRLYSALLAADSKQIELMVKDERKVVIELFLEKKTRCWEYLVRLLYQAADRANTIDHRIACRYTIRALHPLFTDIADATDKAKTMRFTAYYKFFSAIGEPVQEWLQKLGRPRKAE